MRKKLCLTVVLLLSVSAPALGKAEEAETKIQPPAKFEQGVVVEDRLIAVDNRGHLTTTNLTWGGGRDYGKLGRQLQRSIDVANDKACVATENEICEVDLASGKVLRSSKQTVGLGGVGFVDSDRVFIHNGVSMEIIDLAAGKTLHKIELPTGRRTSGWITGKPLIAHTRSDDLLYVARPYQSAVAVVDLTQGKLLKEVKPSEYGWTTGLHVSGNKLFARQAMVSYGILIEHLSVVDLVTGKSERLRFPNPLGDQELRLFQNTAASAGFEMFSTGDAGFILAAHEGLYQYNANGQMVGKSPQALKDGRRAIAVRDGRAVVAGADFVGQIEMSPVKVVAK